MALSSLVVLLCLVVAGCGDLERSNPWDPKAPEFIGDLEDALSGSWVRESQVSNFKQSDRSAELKVYLSSTRQDLQTRYIGTYTLAGNRLTMSFTGSVPLDPSLPLEDIVEISFQGMNTLVMQNNSGTSVSYTRLL